MGRNISLVLGPSILTSQIIAELRKFADGILDALRPSALALAPEAFLAQGILAHLSPGIEVGRLLRVHFCGTITATFTRDMLRRSCTFPPLREPPLPPV